MAARRGKLGMVHARRMAQFETSRKGPSEMIPNPQGSDVYVHTNRRRPAEEGIRALNVRGKSEARHVWEGLRPGPGLDRRTKVSFRPESVERQQLCKSVGHVSGKLDGQGLHGPRRPVVPPWSERERERDEHMHADRRRGLAVTGGAGNVVLARWRATWG